MKYTSNTHIHANISTSAWMIAEQVKTLRQYITDGYPSQLLDTIEHHANRIEFVQGMSLFYGAETLTSDNIRTIWKAVIDGKRFTHSENMLQIEDNLEYIGGFSWHNTAKNICEFITKWRADNLPNVKKTWTCA